MDVDGSGLIDKDEIAEIGANLGLGWGAAESDAGRCLNSPVTDVHLRTAAATALAAAAALPLLLLLSTPPRPTECGWRALIVHAPRPYVQCWPRWTTTPAARSTLTSSSPGCM